MARHEEPGKEPAEGEAAPSLSSAESSLLEALPVPVFIEDLTEVRRYVDELGKQGFTSLEACFSDHPEHLEACAAKVRIIYVNWAALDLYGAESAEELRSALPRLLGPHGLDTFREALLAIAAESRTYRTRSQNLTIGGESLEVGLFFSLDPNSIDTWERVIVVATDEGTQVRTENALKRSADRYRTLVEDQPELICRFRSDGTLTFVNQSYAAYFDKSVDECMGMNLFELVPDESRVELERHFASFSHTEPVRQIQHQVLTSTNEERWMQWTNRALFGSDDGHLVEFQSIGVDITTLKQAQAALEESRRHFQEVFNGAGLGMAILDPDLRLRDVNPVFAELFGHHRHELQGIKVLDITHPDDRRIGLAQVREIAAGKLASASFEKRFVTKDGRTFWGLVTISPESASDERPGYFVASVQDITLRKTMEEQLRLSQQRFREISEHIREAFWLFDWPTQRVIYVSPAFETIWGRPIQSLYEDYEIWGESILEEDREEARLVFERILETGGGEDREYRIQRPDGEVRWILDRGFAIRDDESRVVRIAGIAEDITERRQNEAERRQLEIQVREAQKMESLGLLAGGIAHDFNNLLMGVLGNADLALESLPVGSPARARVENIETSARRAADLANQMLAYSGRGRFVIESVDISTLVEEMSKLLRVSVPKATSLRFDLDRDLPGTEGDATQIRQVVLNLITNASEAISGEVGAISIATGTAECSEEYLRVTVHGEDVAPGDYVYVEVADTGAGMSREVQARIFDPFFTTKFTGRGLGMAAVLGIVRGHRGVIDVTSEPDEGTTIRILLPASKTPVTTRKADTPRGGRWTGHGTVLLADDEPVVRAVAQRMLEHFGFDVLVAEDGEAAVEAFGRSPRSFRLVILDLAMPKMDGREALRRIRDLSTDIPIIVSSGYDEREVDDVLVGQGLCGFIQKPYRLAMLKEGVRKALGEARDEEAG